MQMSILIIEQESLDATNNNMCTIKIKGYNDADCEVLYDCMHTLGTGCMTAVYR